MPTNVFDNTFPPDTQLANLLGQDIRTFKFDMQERMGAISGTLAGRWNPATDSQPLKWTGLLYFTTDTGQIFQWSGAAWVEITSGFFGATKRFSDITHYSFNTVSNNNTTGIVIPANTMVTGSQIRVSFSGRANGTGSLTFGLSFNGVGTALFYTVTNVNFNFFFDMEYNINGTINQGYGNLYTSNPVALLHSDPLNNLLNIGVNNTISTFMNITGTPMQADQYFLNVKVFF